MLNKATELELEYDFAKLSVKTSNELCAVEGKQSGAQQEHKRDVINRILKQKSVIEAEKRILMRDKSIIREILGYDEKIDANLSAIGRKDSILNNMASNQTNKLNSKEKDCNCQTFSPISNNQTNQDDGSAVSTDVRVYHNWSNHRDSLTSETNYPKANRIIEDDMRSCFLVPRFDISDDNNDDDNNVIRD